MLRIGSDLTSRRDFLDRRRTGARRPVAAGASASSGDAPPQQKRPVTDKSVDLPVPARRSEPDRDVRSEDVGPGRRSAASTARCATSLPGVTYRLGLPAPGRLADATTIVRSFKTGDANHDIKPIVCRDTFGANLGSLYARMAGANRPQPGCRPTSPSIRAPSIPSTQPAIMKFGKFESTGPFGAAYAPFAPSGGGELARTICKLTSAARSPRRPPPAAGRA